MIFAIYQNDHAQTFSRIQQMLLTSGSAGRLLLAAALGFAIGVDREIHHRPSGIRTNVLICFGSAMFTFLSAIIAGDNSPNRGQIASNIVQGIGFLGAGLILHNKDRVRGLTSAATVWAVASIGMACGAGLYVPAIFATGLVLFVVELVRALEYRANIKFYLVTYEVRGQDATQMSLSLLQVMDREKRPLANIERQTIGTLERLSFAVLTNSRSHARLLAQLKSLPGISEVLAFRDMEDE